MKTNSKNQETPLLDALAIVVATVGVSIYIAWDLHTDKIQSVRDRKRREKLQKKKDSLGITICNDDSNKMNKRVWAVTTSPVSKSIATLKKDLGIN